jgi:uridine phosphorylase
MEHGAPHHLPITAQHVSGNGGLGRFFLLPGSDGRARRIGERFSALEEVPSPRQHNVYLGRLEGAGGAVDVAAVATGMGCPSVDIIVTELIGLGARLLLRVGTAGSLQPDEVRAGALVIATAAVRDEGVSNRYACPEFPAVADPELVRALESAAVRCGQAERTFTGLVHSKDSLFAREFGFGPRRDENLDYQRQLRALGVLASEMEAAHLFVLGSVHSSVRVPLAGRPHPRGLVRTGCLLAVIGDHRTLADAGEIARAEEAAIDVALEAARELVGRLRAP